MPRKPTSPYVRPSCATTIREHQKARMMQENREFCRKSEQHFSLYGGYSTTQRIAFLNARDAWVAARRLDDAIERAKEMARE